MTTDQPAAEQPSADPLTPERGQALRQQIYAAMREAYIDRALLDGASPRQQIETLVDAVLPVVRAGVTAETERLRTEVDRLTVLVGQYADRGIANGECARKAERERGRYQAAWQSARSRAKAYGEGILQHVADRDTWKRWLKEAKARVRELETAAAVARARALTEAATVLEEGGNPLGAEEVRRLAAVPVPAREQQPAQCGQHPNAPVIGGMCGGCTQYPADMTGGRP